MKPLKTTALPTEPGKHPWIELTLSYGRKATVYGYEGDVDIDVSEGSDLVSLEPADLDLLQAASALALKWWNRDE